MWDRLPEPNINSKNFPLNLREYVLFVSPFAIKQLLKPAAGISIPSGVAMGRIFIREHYRSLLRNDKWNTASLRTDLYFVTGCSFSASDVVKGVRIHSYLNAFLGRRGPAVYGDSDVFLSLVAARFSRNS